MNISITINTNDDELNHECSEKDCRWTYNHMAVADVVKGIVRNIRRGRYQEVGVSKIFDINGNCVGQIEVTE